MSSVFYENYFHSNKNLSELPLMISSCKGL